MADDWRVRFDLKAPERVGFMSGLLGDRDLKHDLPSSFEDRVTVSSDGNELFCYAGSREQAEQAEALISKIAEEHGWEAHSDIKRWHPAEEVWEDPDKPIDTGAEHETLIAHEREETQQRGYGEFEVRVQCPSHHDAVALAKQLTDEGVVNVRRWHHVLVGASDEDAANALADRLRQEVPGDCTVTVEGLLKSTADATGAPSSPFAIFGGMGG